jgi:hypothetical protein
MRLANTLPALLLFFHIFSGSAVFAQQISINEVMASNSTVQADEDGDFEDWIELYNYGSVAINLEGYGLSDDFDDLFQWIFPPVIIEPGHFLLLWASGKDRRPDYGMVNGVKRELHTNFSISIEGEEILLVSPDSIIIDELPSTRIPTDISIGRKPDGAGEWMYFTNPTPGLSNITEAFFGILYPPAFSSPGGYYPGSFELTLFHTEDDVSIIYTTDGSEPSKENLNGSTYVYRRAYRKNLNQPIAGPLISKTYKSYENTGVIRVQDKTRREETQTVVNTRWEPTPIIPREAPFTGTVVSAKAYKEGYIPSEIRSHTYIIREKPYPVPVMSLILPEASFFDYYNGIYVPGYTFDNWRMSNWNATVRGNSPANFNSRGSEWERETNIEYFDEQGNLNFNHRAGVRLHGGFSRSFPQKTLRLYARSEYGTNEFSHQLFPTKDADRFKRFILRASGNDSWSTFFRDAMIQQLVINRPIDTQHWQPVITFLNGEYWGILNMRDRYDQYYLSYKYDVEPDRIDLLQRNAVPKAGGNSHYLQMMDYVRNNNLGIQSHVDHVNTLMDIDNFIEFFAIQIYINNQDWPQNNIDFWRHQTDSYNPDAPNGLDGRWRWMLFDTDFGFWLGNRAPTQNTLAHATLATGDRAWSTELFRNLLANQVFRDDMVNRLADLMNTVFYPDTVLDMIHKMQTLYEEIIDEHINRWTHITSKSLWYNEIGKMRSFATQRPVNVRQHVQQYFNLTGHYNFTVNVGSGAGAIRINSIKIDNPSNWTGIYFNGVPIEVEAIPATGYRFSKWSGSSNSLTKSVTLSRSEATFLEAHFEKEVEQELIYFWAFDGSLANNLPLEDIDARYHAINKATLTFLSSLEGYPFTADHPSWRKASMERRNMPTDINYRAEGNSGVDYDQANIRGIQVKQPFTSEYGENMLVLHMPGNNYKDMVFRFAAKDEGAAENLLIDYSADEEISWITTGLVSDTFTLSDDYQLYTVDFSGISAVDDNPNFRVRIRFEGDSLDIDHGNRVSFNNFSLDGMLMDEINKPPKLVAPVQLQNAVEDGEPLLLNLNDKFNDPDNDPLTFTASSTYPDFVRVQLNDHLLEVIPLRRGDSEIIITADDGNNPIISHSFRILIYPKAHVISEGGFAFKEWDENHPDRTYPAHMIFLQTDTDDPGLSYPLLYPYHIEPDDYHADDLGTIGFPYNNTGRTRINGLGGDGLSFINTGRGRDLGGALVAINTKGENEVFVNWLGGTIQQNQRIYALRMQYRIGTDGTFKDVIDNGKIPQYIANTDGHARYFGGIKLPAEVMDKEYVQVLWRYYHIAGDSGPRSQLWLGEIEMANFTTGISEPEGRSVQLNDIHVFPNPARNFVHVVSENQISFTDIVNISGATVFRHKEIGNEIRIPLDQLNTGMYFIRIFTGDGVHVRKVQVVRE